jgi:hypothetical protein
MLNRFTVEIVVPSLIASLLLPRIKLDKFFFSRMENFYVDVTVRMFVLRIKRLDIQLC